MKLKLTIQKAATEFGVSRETVKRRLNAAGIEPAKTYTLKQIVSALHTPMDAQRIREVRGRAALLEMEVKKRREALVEKSEIERILQLAIEACRAVIKRLPDIAAKCNPSDPEHARAQLQEVVQNFLTTLPKGPLVKK
jgi:hypothetical protein